MKLSVLLFQLVLYCLIATEVSTAPYQAVPDLRYKQDELIVRFKNQSKAAKSISSQNSTLIKKFKHLPLQHIKLPHGVTVQEALANYRKDPNVLYAEPNYIVRKASNPDDTEFGGQWNLPLISSPSAWDIFVGSRGINSVLVAVLDTGIAYYHPDLAQNLWKNSGEICGDGLDNDNNGITDDCYGANFGGFSPGDPWDDDTADSHGTHVAGIIGAVGNNGLGIAGVNWAARIMAVKFLHGPEGLGELSDALRGVEYALANGAKIINMSFETDEESRALRDAVLAIENAGALMVSVAGNLGRDLDMTLVSPASIRSSINIAVAASSRTDGIPDYSGYGRHTVELAAPGGNISADSTDAILSTVWLNNGSQLYRTTAGTSMAAPHVTGAAALIWNLYPQLTGAQVKARILNGVDPVSAFSKNTISGGRLNLENALNSHDIPTVFDVSPFQLSWNGGTITVSGVNFGSVPGSISIGITNLPISSWSDTKIIALVPQQNTGSGIVRVNGQGMGFPLEVLPDVTLTASSISGLTVELFGEVFSSVPVLKCEWDLGDGVFREIEGVTTHISHNFEGTGTYTVKLRVTGADGTTWTGSHTITVTAPSGGGNGCFIATAAYGSYLHPRVKLLRDFRDRHLLSSSFGRSLVMQYYRLSPPAARFIAQHESARFISRLMLMPLVLTICYPVLTMLMIFGGVAVFVSRFFRRKTLYRLAETNDSSHS
jgi:subtilisin family serine protease